jgi:catechol 2,3-dioxygenase-like lactoylglutathione lyase family enzyme
MSIEVRGVCTLIQVFDMPTSVRFYRDVLGFEIVRTTPREGDQFDWGLLRLGDTELMLNTAYEQDCRPAQPDPARIEAHRDICLYFGCPDVEAAYRHLLAHGIDAEKPIVAPWGVKMCYLHDPDGYSLCFQWPDE